MVLPVLIESLAHSDVRKRNRKIVELEGWDVVLSGFVPVIDLVWDLHPRDHSVHHLFLLSYHDCVTFQYLIRTARRGYIENIVAERQEQQRVSWDRGAAILGMVDPSRYSMPGEH